jgi:hypothetical protein
MFNYMWSIKPGSNQCKVKRTIVLFSPELRQSAKSERSISPGYYDFCTLTKDGESDARPRNSMRT